MMIVYRLEEIILLAAFYALVGWAMEVCLIAVTERRFSNRGFLNLPLKASFGVTQTILLLALPALSGNIAMQMIMCIAATETVRRFSELFARGIGDERMRRELVGHRRIAARLVMLALRAVIYYLLYLLVHPMVYSLMLLMPDKLVLAAAIVIAAAVAADFICVRYALHNATVFQMKKATNRMADKMTEAIWKRLRRAYPGVKTPQDLLDGSHVFAEGLCLDKLVWVFLLSSFIGALIEMAYCYLTGGGWMNRSSVLYGPFSFVWGFGAVVLTVTLQRFMQREDRYTFLAGCVIGGTYECLCSVFTEWVFGTVFWDYSHMSLSLAGGRTNVVYCVFWGILSVVWVKILYPLMAHGIERVPLLMGKLITWAIIFAMGCNGILTAAAMVRYAERKTGNAPQGQIRVLLDEKYDDAFMETRWPNMKMTER